MPAALAGVIVKIGVSKLVATIIANVIITAATFVAQKLLFAPKTIKPDQSENTIRNSKPPRVWIKGTRRNYGAQMGFGNYGEANTWDVWAYCEGPVNAVVASYINDDTFTLSSGYVTGISDGAYGDQKVRAGWNLGAETETAHAAVVLSVPAWTSAHRGDGIVSGYLLKEAVNSENFLDRYPQGDQAVMSLVIEGSPCHDPREETSDPYDPTTWPYTDNAALVHLWFRMVIKGNDYATKIAPVEQTWIDAADDCDTAYALSAGGSEAKYRSWLMFDSTSEPADIEDEIRACYDGWSTVDANGCIKAFSGVLYEPTISITSDQIIDYSLQRGVAEESRSNEIIVRHYSADHDYQLVEPEAWRDETDILNRGEVLSTGVDLQIPSHTQGRRIAKRRMARTNASHRGTVKVVHSAREALYERFINLKIEEAGYVFFDDRAEVIGGELDYETGGATIEWVSVDDLVDSWNAATEDGEPAPVETKYYLTPATQPTVDTAVAEFDSAESAARIAITFDAIATTSATWFTRWRIAGDTSWYVEQQDVESGTTVRTGLVPLDESIEVGISYTLAGGRFSDWSTTETVSTATEDLAPAPNGGFTATGGTGDVSGSWSNSTSSNFGHSELWYGSTSVYNDASQLGSDYTGGAGELETFTETLAAGTWYLWSVAFNANNSASSVVGPIEVTVS